MFRLSLPLFLALAVAACGGDGGGTEDDPKPTLTLLDTVVSSDGSRSTLLYNSGGSLDRIEQSQPGNHWTRIVYTYDADGDPMRSELSTSRGFRTVTTYEVADGRIVAARGANGYSSRWFYDGELLIRTEGSDPAGARSNETRYTYADGHVVLTERFDVSSPYGFKPGLASCEGPAGQLLALHPGCAALLAGVRGAALVRSEAISWTYTAGGLQSGFTAERYDDAGNVVSRSEAVRTYQGGTSRLVLSFIGYAADGSVSGRSSRTVDETHHQHTGPGRPTWSLDGLPAYGPL